MGVRIIPARISEETGARAPQHLLRVAGYCRVSTDFEDQETSYEAQVAHYTEYIKNHDGWQLAGIFADEGLSGTSTAKREQFNRMIAECEAGKIDMVITKSISRWARNTLDSLQNIRKLKALGIPVYFEKENCNTMESSGELLITILSSLAQQESQSISQNVRMGLQYGFQQGKPMLTHSTFMGYTKARGDTELTIVPEEADIVRSIFREFLEGFTIGEIKNNLESANIKTPAGKDKWYHSTIISMLKNEKYMGDLLLQKSYVVDFMTKERSKNKGKFPQYYVENAHPPIVPKEVFFRVQGELLRREIRAGVTGEKVHPASHIPLNGKILCSQCGSTYRRVAAPDNKALWRCRHQDKTKPCSSGSVKEKEIEDAVVKAFRHLPGCREQLIRMQERIQWGPLDRLSRELDAIEERKDHLEKILSDHVHTGRLDPHTLLLYRIDDPERNTESVIECIHTEIDDLTEQRDSRLAEKAGLSMLEVQIQTLLKLINRIAPSERNDKYVTVTFSSMQKKEIEHLPHTDQPQGACYDLADFYDRTDRIDHINQSIEYRGTLVKRFIENITVYEDHLMVNFKAGLGIKIERRSHRPVSR